MILYESQQMFGEKKHLIIASPATFQSTGTREKHLESKGDQQKWLKGLGKTLHKRMPILDYCIPNHQLR